ncbi:MAG: hypothetical protein ACT4NP_16190 [Pseudonocardiales bacterium]
MADRLSALSAGGVYRGLNADRDAMSDVDMLAALIEQLVPTGPGQ